MSGGLPCARRGWGGGAGAALLAPPCEGCGWGGGALPPPVLRVPWLGRGVVCCSAPACCCASAGRHAAILLLFSSRLSFLFSVRESACAGVGERLASALRRAWLAGMTATTVAGAPRSQSIRWRSACAGGQGRGGPPPLQAAARAGWLAYVRLPCCLRSSPGVEVREGGKAGWQACLLACLLACVSSWSIRNGTASERAGGAGLGRGQPCQRVSGPPRAPTRLPAWLPPSRRAACLPATQSGGDHRGMQTTARACGGGRQRRRGELQGGVAAFSIC